MPAGLKAREAGHHLISMPMELDCSWCGAGVSLSSGDLCGVCVECGTVMFRPAEKDGDRGPLQPAAAQSV